MKARRAEIERALTAAPAGLFLLHGPDTAGSDALRARLQAALGPEAERVVVTPAALKADPALLPDEAASLSLFGGKRWILVEGGGDDLIDAVTNLLAVTASGNPVVIVAGTLRKGSKLLTLVEAARNAMAYASYLPEGRDAERLVVELGYGLGLRVPPGLARRIAEASGMDRALIALELDKFALYLDASPEHPVALEASVIDSLSAGTEDGDLSRVVDAVLEGDAGALDRELTQLAGSGADTVALLRALSRRVLLLARYRSDVDTGATVDGVMASAGKSLFFKEKPSIARQLKRWPSARLATVAKRLLAAECDFKSPGSLGPDAIAEPLFEIAQAASRER